MAHYNKAELVDALRQVGLEPGRVVFSHSNLGFFGLPEGVRNSDEMCALVLEAILEVIGDAGTLVVPTFTYSFSQGKDFDPRVTPSDCGAFTEYLRQLPESLRSHDPNISVAAFGKNAKELTQNIPVNAYGPDSFFARFLAQDGLICNLNFDAGSTFVHFVERELKVPYRFDKSFEGNFCSGGQTEKRSSSIWVRDLSSDLTIAHFESFDTLARERGCFKTKSVGRGALGAISAQESYRLISETLPERPWLLTKAEPAGKVPELLGHGR